MRIAHVSPFFEEVSVDVEGLEGRGVAFLAKGLVRFGHDVTVFAGTQHEPERRTPLPVSVEGVSACDPSNICC